MELYSSFIKLAPLLILKLLATGAFGASEHDRDRHGRVALAGHVMLMVAVVVGGFVSILVLGDVLPPTAATRWVLVVAGCLSLLLLANFKLGQIATLYRVRPRARSLVGTSGEVSATPAESS
jgi:lipopolysaccharide export LptBFGC system permease protein LptF